MALMRVGASFADNEEIMGWLRSAFDKMYLVARQDNTLLFFVTHDEIPNDYTYIEPAFISFPLIRPFVIDWGIQNTV